MIEALRGQIQTLPSHLARSLTWDRGHELTAHKTFTVQTGVEVYFCDPHSPWQRGSNENTNGLLRQYLPKGTDLAATSQTELDEIARKLNDHRRCASPYGLGSATTVATACPARATLPTTVR